MARVLKMAHGRISLAHSIHWHPNFLFLLSDQCLHIVRNICVHTHIWLHRDCIRITGATKLHCSEKLLHELGAVRKVYWKIITVGLPSSDWVNTWHWTKHFTIPAIYRLPNCPNEKQFSIPFPTQQQLWCFCNDNLTVSTGFSARILYLFFASEQSIRSGKHQQNTITMPLYRWEYFKPSDKYLHFY
jgi:hypothetical protein